MSVAYADEPRRPRHRIGPHTHACSLCGEYGHQRNSAIHRPAGAEPPGPASPPSGRRCSVCGETGHRANSVRHRDVWQSKPAAPPVVVDPEGDVTPAVAQLRAHQGKFKRATIPPKPLTSEEKRAAALVVLDDADRPKTRGDCKNVPRPCPFVSCSAHLYLDVAENGTIKLNYPDKEPWELVDSCALDLADTGVLTLEDVGAKVGLTRERVRQIEERSIRKIRMVAPELAEAGVAPIELPCVDDRLRRR